MRWRRWLMWSLVGLLGVLLLIQFVPYGRAHSNPPMVTEPPWDTRLLVIWCNGPAMTVTATRPTGLGTRTSLRFPG